ncbi:hypothetical protein [Jannaschia sp. LMIT008]|uniref:hypothetical protein n=1 Tax=Jannaschia maritima TaxID=3032585 RepID=UPI002812722A|nr:hypothetical protein [Jannaschia sp. LMIT008]
MTRYLYATDRPWALEAFSARRAELPGTWTLVTVKADLAAAVEAVRPRYAFFPHWSHIVPEAVLAATECVCFHMTDVPYGRGGSPLQNLIARGHRETVLTALRMTAVLDAGPVYLKAPLSLDGPAHAIFARMADRAIDLMARIARDEPRPEPQPDATGQEAFARRTPAQSVLPGTATPEGIHDHIRMLDAPGYPHAYLDHGELRITLRDAALTPDGTVTARATIRRRDDGA